MIQAGKIKVIRFFLITFTFFSFSLATTINIDEILSEKNTLRLTTQLSYINIKNKDAQFSTLTYSLSDTNFITLPLVDVINSNEDYLNVNLALRYGINNRIEIFSSVNGYYHHILTKDTLLSFYEKNSGNFNNWNLGVAIEAKKEGKLPALLLGFSTDLLGIANYQNKNKLNYLNTYNFFISSYYTIDPIVFFLQGNFYFSLDDHFSDVILSYGKVFSLAPTIYFAINPDVSLNFGIKYMYKSSDKINHKVVNLDGSSIAYNFGISCEITQKVFFFADTEFLQTSSYTSNAFNLTFLFKF